MKSKKLPKVEEDEVIIDKSTHKKKSAKRKRKDVQSDTSLVIEDKVQEDDNMLIDENTSKKKSAKRKRNDVQLEASSEAGEETPVLSESKKRKKGSKSISQNDNKESATDSQQPLSVKKSKKEKKKKQTEESLGIVDTNILQQAEINLGLPQVYPTSSHNKGNDNEEKPKKKKKKSKETKSEVVSSNDEPNEKSKNEKAVQYLRLWHSNKQAWKFNKRMQVQLLHTLYDKSMFTGDDFDTLLLYLEGMKGKGREKTKEDAKKIIDDGETGSVDADKEDRARQIFQMLA